MDTKEIIEKLTQVEVMMDLLVIKNGKGHTLTQERIERAVRFEFEHDTRILNENK